MIHFRDTSLKMVEQARLGEVAFFKTATPGPYHPGDRLALRNREHDQQVCLDIVQVGVVGVKEPVFILGLRSPQLLSDAATNSLLTKWSKEIVRRDNTGEGNLEDLAQCCTDLRAVAKKTQ